MSSTTIPSSSKFGEASVSVRACLPAAVLASGLALAARLRRSPSGAVPSRSAILAGGPSRVPGCAAGGGPFGVGEGVAASVVVRFRPREAHPRRQRARRRVLGPARSRPRCEVRCYGPNPAHPIPRRGPARARDDRHGQPRRTRRRRRHRSPPASKGSMQAVVTPLGPTRRQRIRASGATGPRRRDAKGQNVEPPRSGLAGGTARGGWPP